MITYDITIISKSKQALNFYFLFLNKINQPKITLLTNYTKQKTLIKKIVTLKSPHVNKKAQKHFEYRIFSKKIRVSSYNEIKSLIFLKKLKTKLFPEIKFKIKILSNKNKKTKNNFLNPKNYYINSIITRKNMTQTLNSQNIKIINIQPCYKIKNYLKILDCYGEFNMK